VIAVLRFAAALLALTAVACSESYTGPGDPAFPIIAPADETGVPEQSRALYAEDAAQLALRYVESSRAPADRDPQLPAEIVAAFYNALLHVYNERHQARDSVADMFRIHAFPSLSTHELLVEVDIRADWTAPWLVGEPLTGLAEIDSLVNRYELRITKVFSPAPIHTYVVLFSKRPLDMRTLGKRFLSIAGIEAADANQFVGAGNDIEGTIEPGILRLAYSVGFGDCPAGCINRHYWFFEITEDGAARYRGTNGDPIPTLTTLEATPRGRSK
jgi:hypothetical protein